MFGHLRPILVSLEIQWKGLATCFTYLPFMHSVAPNFVEENGFLPDLPILCLEILMIFWNFYRATATAVAELRGSAEGARAYHTRASTLARDVYHQCS